MKIGNINSGGMNRRREYRQKQNNMAKWSKERELLRDKVIDIVLNTRRYTKKSWLIENLYDAYCEYERIFESIINNPKPNFDLLEASFTEIYWHTNIAYHTRNIGIRNISKTLMKDNLKFGSWTKCPRIYL